jgi:hypothetical protein
MGRWPVRSKRIVLRRKDSLILHDDLGAIGCNRLVHLLP